MWATSSSILTGPSKDESSSTVGSTPFERILVPGSAEKIKNKTKEVLCELEKGHKEKTNMYLFITLLFLKC